jgi:type IV pilus assembly protein PilY1
MNCNPNKVIASCSWLTLGLLASLSLSFAAQAAPLALANAPLATSTTITVKPNLMFVLDNSGSMDFEYLPDSVNNDKSNHCYRNSTYNGVYYNPNMTYVLPVTSTGTNYSSASFNGAWVDGYSTGSGSTNLSSKFRAGDDNTDHVAYYYKYTGLSPVTPVRGVCYSDASYTLVNVGAAEQANFANWYSYYRTRILMMKTAAGLAFKDIGDAYRIGFTTISYTGVDSTNAGFMKIADFNATNKATWYSKLYGASANGSTPLRGALSKVGRMYAGQLLTGANDPIQYSCQQNFTLISTDGYWNTPAESTSYGPFKIDNATPVGNQDATEDRPMFDGGASGLTKTYTRNSYSTSGSGCSGSTKKLRTQAQIGSCVVATAAANCTPSNWTNNGSPTNGSCVASPTIPSPNPSAAVQSGSPVAGTIGGSSDSLADIAMYYYKTDLRTPALANCSGSITGENLCDNNVFTGGADNNLQQHMTTFTLGLGVNGRMVYSPSYTSDTTGDFVAVKLGSTASATVCTWQAAGSVCNWPIPGDGWVENIDDLWHAAIDGRGAYFSATDPETLVTSLASALSGLNARQGSAAAAATSTLNPVAGNNAAFVASYTSIKWTGNLEARGINVDTGAVNTNADWCVEDVPAGTCSSPSSVVSDITGGTTAYFCKTPGSPICNGGKSVGSDCLVPIAISCTGSLKSRVTDISDTRKIYTANSTGTALIPFDTAYASANSGYFSTAYINTLTQWPTLSPAQQSAAAGANLLNFLRGQTGYEDRTTNPVANRLYRYREATLGDSLESQPVFIAEPVFGYPYTGYSTFATNNANRPGTVYIGSNDGMLHAFAAKTASPDIGGTERWAYAPSMVIPNMWKLADSKYDIKHTNYVNGSVAISDIFDGTAWRTILVGGLNGGGRGYYALDITNPNSPSLLWEFTTTTGIGSTKDDDVGYGFGRPVITMKVDGTWVVLLTSGYNNVSPGSGQGYLFVLNATTGTVISKIGTGAGNATTPSGLSKIVAWNNDSVGNKTGYIYGGDLLGNLWRFEINTTPSAMLFATLSTGGGAPQPITTRPELGKIGGKRVIFVGTGKYLELTDLTTSQVQSYYAIKDNDETATLTNPRTTLVQQIWVDSGNTRTASSNPVDFNTGRGWFIDFPDSGERMNIEAKLVQGVLVVPTLVPSNTVCSPGGYGWLNYLCYETGGACMSSTRYDSTIVGINTMFIDGNAFVSVVTTKEPTPNPDLHGKLPPPPPPGFTGTHMNWHELVP